LVDSYEFYGGPLTGFSTCTPKDHTPRQISTTRTFPLDIAPIWRRSVGRLQARANGWKSEMWEWAQVLMYVEENRPRWEE